MTVQLGMVTLLNNAPTSGRLLQLRDLLLTQFLLDPAMMHESQSNKFSSKTSIIYQVQRIW